MDLRIIYKICIRNLCGYEFLWETELVLMRVRDGSDGRSGKRKNAHSQSIFQETAPSPHICVYVCLDCPHLYFLSLAMWMCALFSRIPSYVSKTFRSSFTFSLVAYIVRHVFWLHIHPRSYTHINTLTILFSLTLSANLMHSNLITS